MTKKMFPRRTTSTQDKALAWVKTCVNSKFVVVIRIILDDRNARETSQENVTEKITESTINNSEFAPRGFDINQDIDRKSVV